VVVGEPRPSLVSTRVAAGSAGGRAEVSALGLLWNHPAQDRADVPAWFSCCRTWRSRTVPSSNGL